MEDGVKMISLKKMWLSTLSYLNSIFQGREHPADLWNDSFMYGILNANNNQPIFMTKLEERQVELCVIVMGPLDSKQTAQTFSILNNQTYRNWKMIIQANDLSEVISSP